MGKGWKTVQTKQAAKLTWNNEDDSSIPIALPENFKHYYDDLHFRWLEFHM
jgi:hypothetical protein